MRAFRLAALIATFTLTLTPLDWGATGPFAVFPKAGRLLSPDRRYEVRDASRAGSFSDFAGSFHSLWVFDLAGGQSRKLCDYFGTAAVAWSGNSEILITEYVSKKISRALLFHLLMTEQPIVIDEPTLLRTIDPELRQTIRGNDHVFIEAERIENGTFYFRVWGYGQHDPKEFHWNCQQRPTERMLDCSAVH